MLESVSITKLGFAERMARALELFNVQRMAEQDARAKELQLWANLFQAVFRTTEQALKPFNVQRMAEQDARATELQLWANLF